MEDKSEENKGFDISSLIPEKIAVETEMGTLYVRHRWADDLERIRTIEKGGAGPAEAIVRLYASLQKDKDSDTPPLRRDDFASLSSEDIKNVLLAVAQH